MNGPQESITAAFAVIAIAIVGEHSWQGTLPQWARSPVGPALPAPVQGALNRATHPPDSQPSPAGGAAAPAPATAGVPQWLAAVIVYAILLALAENDDAAELAVLIAWALAFLKAVAFWKVIESLGQKPAATQPAPGAQGAVHGT